MEQAFTQLDVKILFDDFTYHANISNKMHHSSDAHSCCLSKAVQNCVI